MAQHFLFKIFDCHLQHVPLSKCNEGQKSIHFCEKGLPIAGLQEPDSLRCACTTDGL